MNETNLEVWEITENEVFFLSKLNGFPLVLRESEKIKHALKRLQFLASRYLLLRLLEPQYFSQIEKSSKGKLFVSGLEGIHLSVSHSGHFAAVVVSSVSVGVDIQEYDERLLFLSRKFVNDAEKEWINIKDSFLDYHLIWGAKESIFKAWGKGQLDFKENMFIEPGQSKSLDGNSKNFRGFLKKANNFRNYKVWSYKGDDLFLVVAIEEKV